MKKTFVLVSLLGGIACAVPAQAQFAKAEDAIKYRKASLTLMATHFGRLGAMAQGNKLPYAAFVEGSDKGETRAKPEIWKESAKFKEAVDKNQAEMAKVVAAAKTGNLDALKAAVGPAGSSCKACHDNFRKD